MAFRAADGAGNDAVADDVTGSTVNAERRGNAHVLLQSVVHLGARCVLFEFSCVEAEFAGDCERRRANLSPGEL
jgi:hypothetical protein